MLPTFGYTTHAISSKGIRVAFDRQAELSAALDPASYTLSTMSGYVPAILSVREYELGGVEVELVLDASLSFGSTYTIQAENILSADGLAEVDTAGHNFDATVPDYPIAIGAYLSKRGFIDVVFDRSVGQYSTPSATLFGTVGPGVAMSYVTWDATIPENSLRFAIPVGAPSSDSWVIDYSGVMDISGNSGNRSVDVSIPLSVPRPLTYAQSTQAQIIDSFLTSHSQAFLMGNVRVYFNCPMNVASSVNPANWNVSQVGVHGAVDVTNPIVSPDATDLPSLIILTNELKLNFNRHISEPNVHIINDIQNFVSVTNAIDASTASAVLDALQIAYDNHRMSEYAHSASDGSNWFPYSPPTPLNVPNSCVIANNLKASFNGHLLGSYPVSFVAVPNIGGIGYGFCSYWMIDHAEPFTWFVDLRVPSASPKSSYLILADIQSEDLGSSTSSLNYTGTSTSRPATSPISVVSTIVHPDSKIVVDVSGEIQKFASGFDVSISIDGRASPGPVVKRKTSLHAAIWALADLWISYDLHRTSQTHTVVDSVNVMSPSDVPFPPIDFLINSANSFLSKFSLHRTSDYHVHDDLFSMNLSDSYDEESFINLVESLCVAFDSHSMNSGIHGGDSSRTRSAPLGNSLSIETGIMLNGGSYSMSADLLSMTRDTRDPSGSHDIVTQSLISTSFPGISIPPVVAAAVPRQAYSVSIGGGIKSDEVQAFFSKPMDQGSLDLLTISGGSIMTTMKSWASPSKVTVNIVDMQPTSYTLSGSGLKDIAGNQVP